MPIPVKIQCGCGQRYAFDVETVSSLGPNSVACPVCGADGTNAANAVIAQNLSAAPPAAAATVAPTESPGLRLAASSPSTQTARSASRLASQMLQVDPEKARAEAWSKMMWGDSPEEVTSFLRMQGFSKEDASALVRELVKQRKSAIRAIGIRKIVTGIALIFVPIITLVVFVVCFGVILLKVMAVAIMVGLWGVWRLINGTIMFLAPKSQPGGLADQ